MELPDQVERLVLLAQAELLAAAELMELLAAVARLVLLALRELLAAAELMELLVLLGQVELREHLAAVELMELLAQVELLAAAEQVDLPAAVEQVVRLEQVGSALHRLPYSTTRLRLQSHLEILEMDTSSGTTQLRLLQPKSMSTT
jgi:hypothetical protein